MPLSGVFIGRPRATGARLGTGELPATSHYGLGDPPAGGSLLSALLRVRRNLAINEFRKSHTRYRLFDRVVEAMRPAARNPEQEYETRERKELVLEMLQTLPEDQRRALLLREQEQLSYREIGEVLNISESKVKVDIFRARAALRERWSKRVKVAGASVS